MGPHEGYYVKQMKKNTLAPAQYLEVFILIPILLNQLYLPSSAQAPVGLSSIAAAGWEDVPEHSQPNSKSVCCYNNRVTVIWSILPTSSCCKI